MDANELEKLLKLLALIQAGIRAANEILVNKATQGGMTTEEIFARAEKHNDEALELINNL